MLFIADNYEMNRFEDDTDTKDITGYLMPSVTVSCGVGFNFDHRNTYV